MRQDAFQFFRPHSLHDGVGEEDVPPRRSQPHDEGVRHAQRSRPHHEQFAEAEPDRPADRDQPVAQRARLHRPAREGQPEEQRQAGQQHQDPEHHRHPPHERIDVGQPFQRLDLVEQELEGEHRNDGQKGEPQKAPKGEGQSGDPEGAPPAALVIGAGKGQDRVETEQGREREQGPEKEVPLKAERPDPQGKVKDVDEHAEQDQPAHLQERPRQPRRMVGPARLQPPKTGDRQQQVEEQRPRRGHRDRPLRNGLRTNERQRLKPRRVGKEQEQSEQVVEGIAHDAPESRSPATPQVPV